MVPYNETISYSVQAEFFFCSLEVNSEQNMSREKPVCLKQQAWRVIHRITPSSHAFQIFRHPPCLSDMPIYKGYFGQDKNIHTGFYGV